MSMFLLVILASILIAVVTIFQYREEAKDYHSDRLQRKETSIRENIDYMLKNTTYPVETEYIALIFKNKIYEIKDIHNLEIYLYDLDGQLLMIVLVIINLQELVDWVHQMIQQYILQEDNPMSLI